MTITFHNETDAPILLDDYSSNLSPSRITPLDGVEVTEHPPLVCDLKRPPTREDTLLIPARGQHVRTQSQWAESLCVNRGMIQDGKIEDRLPFQSFRLPGAGERTLVFAFRSDGFFAPEQRLTDLVRPDEKLWSGRVYSNPVTINFAPPHHDRPVPAGHTGDWTDFYPDGKQKRQVARYKDGKLEGPLVGYWPDGGTHYEQNYRAGEPEGLSAGYDRQGRKLGEATFSGGKPHGRATSWYPNGQKAFEGQYRDGLLDGPRRTWYENGQLRSQGNYQTGQRIGRWTEWDRDGKVVWSGIP